MSNKAALETLEARLAELVRKGNALVEVINDLRVADGIPPMPPLGGGGGIATGELAGATPTSIKPDSFYGKKLQTAVREYLEMRYAMAGNRSNPATPKEIHEAIEAGGYQFEAKSADIAVVGLRALLRKRTNFFHKLPNGSYGLTIWYPDAKKPKAQADDDQNDGEAKPKTEAATTTKMAAAS